MNKPYSQACENNKDPILSVLKTVWTQACSVLEIGSGTGQHAVYFAKHLSHLEWQPSDQAEYLSGIQSWIDEAELSNLKSPINLNVNDDPWPLTQLEAVFSANTLHIMSLQDVEIFFQRLGSYLKPRGNFICYGPFNKNGQYTSNSNQNFDRWLKDRDPLSGIRNIESLTELAEINQLKLLNEIDLPANNKILIWEKQ